MPKFYTSVILLIFQSREIGEEQFSVFGSRGGGGWVAKLPLYARTPLGRSKRAKYHMRDFKNTTNRLGLLNVIGP